MSRLATTCLVLFVFTLGVIAAPAQARNIAAYPSPGSTAVSDETTISFRGIKPAQLGKITVRGSKTGLHKGRFRVHSDRQGISFLPRRSFRVKERVTVTSSRHTFFGTSSARRFSFSIALMQPKGWRNEPQVPPEGDTPPEFTTYKSFPFKVPKVKINISKPEASAGKTFYAPRTNGPIIVDEQGELVYYRPGHRVTDFRVQSYRGKPVLTWWRRAQVGKYVESSYAIADSSYKVFQRFEAGNGYTSDPHEFTMASPTTAFVNSFRTVIVDLRKLGGLKRTPVMDNVAQEIDLATGQVLWEWHSLGNVKISETYMPIPRKISRSFDYFHLNSISRDRDGNMIFSARHTRALYKVNRLTGKLMWRMGGKDSDFKTSPGMNFAYQHDFRPHADGTYSVFDNGAAGGPLKAVSAFSRGLIFRIDEANKTTSLVKSFAHPEKILATSQGNTQVMPNGNVFVGWGSVDRCTEYNPEGEAVFDISYSAVNVTYRCYKEPWTGNPRPGAIGVKSETEGADSKVWVSWNGDTRVKTWRVLAGGDKLTYVTKVPRDGFETEIPISGAPARFRLVGLDGQNKVIGRSRINRLGELTR